MYLRATIPSLLSLAILSFSIVCALVPLSSAAQETLSPSARASNNTIPSGLRFDGPDWEPAGYAGPDNQRWSGSIMFPLNDLHSLNKVLDAYRKGLASDIEDPNAPDEEELAEDELDKILEELTAEQFDEEEQPEETPLFHLGSIMYISPDHWSVWLNGVRINAQSPDTMENIEIVDIAKDFAEIRWRPHAIGTIKERWNERLEHPSELEALGREEFDIGFHKDRTVTFILHPNQTLYTDAMEIVEGRRMAPRTLLLQRLRERNQEHTDNATMPMEDALENAPSSPSPPPAAAARPGNDEERANKLINQYLGAGKALGLVPSE